jgi:hypothetical protein
MSSKTEHRGLKLSVRKIGPKAARDMLESFELGNRRVMGKRVEKLQNFMEEGNWVLSDPLMFDKKGALLNGQHRLSAVVASKQTVEFVCITGYDREKTFGHIDDVAPRSLRSWLEIRGEEGCAVLAPVVNMANRYTQGLIPAASMSNRTSSDQLIDFLDNNPEIRESVAKAPGTSNKYAPKAMQVFLHWAFSQRDKKAANKFFIDLVTADGDGVPSPIKALRSRLVNDREATKKMGQAEKIALFIKAWNGVRSNREIKILSWGVNKEAFPPIM